MNRTPIKVALVDDNQELRDTVFRLIKEATPRFLLVGTFADAETALQELPALSPDIILMDIGLPQMSGVECTRELAHRLPDTQIMMLTVFEDYQRIYQSLCAGATGYLLKKDIGEKLLDDMAELHAGGSPMSSSIARKVVLAFRQMGNPQNEMERLSRREQEILAGLSQGNLYKEIALQLGISTGTVRSHIQRIFKKLQVCNRRDAVNRTRFFRLHP
ncbi:MAG: response regulator transcription factor [Verrucomicrobiales bacterium]|nr:response regulator transcription factor [Verrucomicrobiales bacterium]